MACFAARRSLFSLVQNRVQPAWEMKDDGFVHVVATKKGERKEKRRRNSFMTGEKLIRIISDQSMISLQPNFLRAQKKSFLSFLFLLIGRFQYPIILTRALAEVRLRFSF